MTTNRYEEERLRAQEQTQIVYLQGQIDELRRLMKEQTNKYNWAVEQVRRVEAGVAQVQEQFDKHAEQMAQGVELQRREIAALRRDVAAALVRIDESTRPIREMQSQIQQLGEARRQDRDQVAPWLTRIEDLEVRSLGLQSQIRDGEDRTRQLTAQLAGLSAADELSLQEVRKIAEDLQIEKQSLRRQAVEAQQLVADVHTVLDDHDARLTHLAAMRQHLDALAETLPGQISAIDARLPDIVADVKRVERISTERFLMNQERLEELRRQGDEKYSELREAEDQQVRRLVTWLERLDAWCREIETRATRVAARLDVVQATCASRLDLIEARELRVLEGMLDAVRSQLEQTRAAQIEGKSDTGAAQEQHGAA